MTGRLCRRGALFLGVMLLVSVSLSRIPQYRAVYAAGSVEVVLNGTDTGTTDLLNAFSDPADDTDIVITIMKDFGLTDQLPEPITRNVTFNFVGGTKLWLERSFLTFANGASAVFTGNGSLCTNVGCELNVDAGGTLTIDQNVILDDPESFGDVTPIVRKGATLVLDGATYPADIGAITVSPNRQTSVDAASGPPPVPPTDTETPPTDTTDPPTDTTNPPTDTTNPPTDTTNPPTDTTNPPTDTTNPPTDTQNPPTASNPSQATGEEPPKLPDTLADSVSGRAQLLCGVAYRLGDGNWRVKGDSTVYQGGNVFYVTEDGEYELQQE